MRNEVCLLHSGVECTRKFFTQISLKKRSITLRICKISSINLSLQLTMSYIQTSWFRVTMTSTSYSKTWLNRASSSSSETDRCSTLWNQSQMLLSFVWVVPIKLLELTHPQALSQLSVFRRILRQFVLFHSKKRTVISFSGHCIANIFAIWTQSLATLKVFWACVNYSRSYYRHTSQKYVTTWVS